MYKILLVDDEDKIREVLAKFLSKAGFEIQEAAGGQEAIDILRQGTLIDLMVVDMKMPKINGMGVLEERKKLGRTFPFFLLTGSVDADKYLDSLQNLGLQEENLCYKPVDLFELLDKIKKILGPQAQGR